MKSINRFAVRLTALATIVALGGCLGDEVQTTAAAPDPGAGGPTNTAPVITGNPPAAVLVGDPYSFTPQASDADGDTLTFTIQNRPTWASFDTNSGQVSGTPTLGDVGLHTNIQVSVSDGQITTTMSGFSVDVTQVATASTTLSWSAPTLNEDGSALTDLAGYKLFYGLSSGNYTNEIRIDNASITTYVVDNLTPTTYYFAAKSFNSSGVESQFSGEAVKILN